MSDMRKGQAWKRARAAWAPAVASGAVRCARCRHWIKPGEPWQLGHPDDMPAAVAAHYGAERDVIAACRPEHRTCGQRASNDAKRSAQGGRIVTAPRGKLWDDMS